MGSNFMFDNGESSSKKLAEAN